MAKKKETFSQREIAAVLNNAVLRSLKPTRITELSDKRIQKLQDYAQALVEPTVQHVEEGLLCYEELVAALSAAALFVHLKHIMGSDKVPMSSKAKAFMEKTDETD